MEKQYSKAGYLKTMLKALRDPDLRTAEEEHQLQAYHDVSRFIHYINGRVFDVLQTRNPKCNIYAAAYTWYPKEVTDHYPVPDVDPKTSVRELMEDMKKVETIRSLAGYSAYVEGLKWIDKKTLRACINISQNDEHTIQLEFADREPLVLSVIHSTSFVELCADPEITAKKIVDFFKADDFSISPDLFFGSLLDKIPPSELRGFLDYIESIKLHDAYERKFNALLIRDMVRRRYDAYQRGNATGTEIAEVHDDHTEVRNFMIDMVQFLDSIRNDEEGESKNKLADGGPGGNPKLSPQSKKREKRISKSKASKASTDTQNTSLTVRGIDERHDPLPSYDLASILNASPGMLASKMSGLLSYVHRFLHRIPENRLAELGIFFDRACALVKKLPAIWDTDKNGRESPYPLMVHIRNMLTRMHNGVYLKQMMNGTLDFPDRTGNFDVDELMTHPWAFARETAYHLTDRLYYSWVPGDYLGRENLSVSRYIEEVTPAVRERYIALMQQRGQALEENASLRRLGYEG